MREGKGRAEEKRFQLDYERSLLPKRMVGQVGVRPAEFTAVSLTIRSSPQYGRGNEPEGLTSAAQLRLRPRRLASRTSQFIK